MPSAAIIDEARKALEELSSAFGKDYSYKFNYSEVRGKLKEVAEKAGYQLDYQLVPVK
jgi:hypothetical protein